MLRLIRLLIHRSSFRVHSFSKRLSVKTDCPCSNYRPGLSTVNSTVRVDHKRSDFSKGRCGQRPCLRDSSRKLASGLSGLSTSGKHVFGTHDVQRYRRSCDPCERDSISSHTHFLPHAARAAFLVRARTPDSAAYCCGSFEIRQTLYKSYICLGDRPTFPDDDKSYRAAE